MHYRFNWQNKTKTNSATFETGSESFEKFTLIGDSREVTEN